MDDPKVFDWEAFRELAGQDRVLCQLAFRQWVNGNDEEFKEEVMSGTSKASSFHDGFRQGWTACRAVAPPAEVLIGIAQKEETK